MANIHALMTLINKIFPSENCTSNNVAEFIQRLALKDVSQNNEHFAPVQPPQVNQSGRYSPEKITQKPSTRGQQSEPYATFKKMRQVGGVREEYLSYYANDAELFFKQAQFMKDFTDNYDQKIPLDTYYATYGTMDDAQLRTYFTWRTKVRQGVIEDTSLSYAFCYIFELLNDVGVSSPADAIEKVITLWTAFRRYNENMDVHLREWIRDYYVVHKPQLAVEFSAFSRSFPVPYHHGEDAALLAKAKACNWDDLRAIEASSSFRITNGQFYKAADQAMIEKCACFVIQELAKLFKSGGVDLRNMFIEKRREKIYSLFRGAVHRNLAVQPITVQLDDFEMIKLNSRGWYREYLTLTQYRSVIGYVLKCIEVKMREHFGYKRNLQIPNISQVENSFLYSEPDKFTYPTRPTMNRLKAWKQKAFSVISSTEFESTIVRAIAEYCKLAHLVIVNGVVKEIKLVEIDLSKLKDIEKEHLETAAKLIIEEQPAPVVEVTRPATIAPDIEIAGMAGFVDSLPEEGRTLLITLLNGGQVPPNSELLIETINTKALEAIADNMIDYSESVPYVYDDYTDELKSLLGGQ
ncbi:TerB N-terminal domain-containing protein [Desulfitobacterium sp. Sab5]|uniref:TerB N- and C- terminal domain-containing protein n=1 Tax=Desulfitobacterium nosdiversum TaxID=3375356 RepID=UPI003CF5B4A3